jgi:ATP synthase I chain
MNLERIEIFHIAALGAAAIVAAATGWLHVGSLLFGGIVMLANFRLLKEIVRRALRPGKGQALAFVLFAAKFGLFLGLLALVFWRVPVEGISFAVGVTLLLACCVVEALRATPPMGTQGTV